MDNEMNHADVIALLNIYRSEWIHRNEILWTLTFRFFFCCLAVILLPNMTEYFGFSMGSIPPQLFRIVGGVFGLFYLFVAVSSCVRLETIDSTYKRVLKKLPADYIPAPTIKDDFPKYRVFSHRVSYTVCLSLFLLLEIIAVIFFIADLTPSPVG